MTRKDYIALAAALHATRPGGYGVLPKNSTDSQWEGDVRAVADVLAADNPRFNRDRFIAAARGER